MIILGVILLVAGFILGMSILTTVGVILLVVGLVLLVAGRMGHAVGGRRHYF
jgi:membrane-bound ClpP family serine protease